METMSQTNAQTLDQTDDDLEVMSYQLAGEILRNGGVSVAIYWDDYSDWKTRTVSQGYALSIYPEHEVITGADFDGLALEIYSFMLDNGDMLDADDGTIFGAWLDETTGKVYLDLSLVEHNLSQALRLARQFKQLAIYDLTHGETIRLD